MSGWGRTSGSARCRPCPRESIGLVAAFCLGLRAARQAHREHRALARLARHGHVAAHHACELAREGKAEPRSAVAARGQGIGLGEFLEQLRLLFGGQADAGIRDGKLDPVASVRHPAHPQGHLALFRELTGIAQEIEQDLLEPHGVRGERAQVLLGFDDKAVLVLLGELSSGADDIIDKSGQIDRLGIELELAGFDLRKVEHLVDEAQEVGAGGIHAAQRFQRFFRAEARRIADHHLGQANDGVKRRAQLVAHAGEELRLVLARHLELAVFVLNLVEQPHVLDGDHRLVGEGRRQLYLLVGERPRFDTTDRDAPDGLARRCRTARRNPD
jgi:hypothetical protein